MSSHERLSGNPSELELMLSGMCIKREINDVETGSRAYFESMIYINNRLREFLLEDMQRTNNELIASSKDFLASTREVITQQNEFIEMFAIQPDADERNELKIVSKGWYNLLLRQLMMHRDILTFASNQAAEMEDGDRLRKISRVVRWNCQIERQIRRDLIERYPPARN